MKRYDSYKDSGVKWLGEIPSHWNTLPGLAVFSENKSKNTLLSYNTVLSLSYGKILVKKDINEGLVPTDYNTYQIVHPGYIIIRCTDLQNDKVSLRTGLVKNDGIITNAYLGLIVNKEYNYSYIYYFLHAWDVTKEIYRHGSGLRQSLSWLDLRRLPILLPSIEEQVSIANYLDEATSKIDSVIAQQQKMIDLLNERKQIIINNAVTKGLDPNVKMKPSGVDWIGDIPGHWEIVPIKRYNNVCTGKTPNTTKEYYFENGDICWYTPGDLNQFNLNSSERKVTERAKKENACPIFPSNTVYLVGIGGTIGKVSYAERESSCNQQINAIVPQKDYVYYKYLAYFLQTFKIQIYQNANLSTLPIINQERTGALQMLLPPQVEQKAIVEYIEKVIRPIDFAIEGTNKQISLLQERKQIIINDVVTGKVKVV